MTTVLECHTEEQRSFLLLFFLWAKRPSAKNIRKEMFPVYGGKCLSRKGVHNLIDKFSQGRSKVADDDRPGAEVAETTVKRLPYCGFRRTGKTMGQAYQCWWRICYEMFFPASNVACFAFYIHLWPAYLLTAPLNTTAV
jgi:hypothetical protein